ncbi:MAG: YbhB/YbcL family Raf kinase inhibitor-like protein [Phycisphaeraceae bacterium]
MKLSSPAMEPDQPTPTAHTAEGGNLSPPLHWADVPEGAAELALIMIDLDATSNGQPFVHWLVYGISPHRPGLPGGLLRRPRLEDLGAAQGKNSFGHVGYDGPAPPADAPPHRYRLDLVALARPLGIEPRASYEMLRSAMSGAELARASLVTRCGRSGERR